MAVDPVLEIKRAIASKSATTTTVTALKALLSPDRSLERQHAAAKHLPGSTESVRTTKSTSTSQVRRNATIISVSVHQDAPQCLSTKAKYALATEVINACLRELSAATKTSKSVSQPLGLLPPNSSPQRQVKSKSSPSESGHAPKFDFTVAAECISTSFSFLRSAEAAKLGSRSWQVESGMLAFSSCLTALGMESLAIHEIQILKRMLTKPPIKPAETKKETLASLLDLSRVDVGSQKALELATSVQLLVLKIVAARRQPAAIEAALRYCDPAYPGSPVNLLQRLAQCEGMADKASRQLDSMSRLLLSLCPSSSPGADSVSADPQRSPSLAAVLALQLLALRIRKIWWPLAAHHADEEKDLLHPFVRSLSTYLRRTPVPVPGEIYDEVLRAFEALSVVNVAARGESLFDLYRTMASLSQACSKSDEAEQWLERELAASRALDPSHARAIACQARLLDLRCRLNAGNVDDLHSQALNLGKLLSGQVSGRSADYDELIQVLAHLMQALSKHRSLEEWADVVRALLIAAARYAQRYFRSYGDRKVVQICAIVHAALGACTKHEHLGSWVSADTLKILMHEGALRDAAVAASTLPIREAWATSGAAIAMDKVLQSSAIQSVKISQADEPIIPGNEVPADQLLTALERYLHHLLPLAARPKYHRRLRERLASLLAQLEPLFAEGQHPLRQSVIATTIAHLSSEHPEIVDPEVLHHLWHGVDLVKDEHATLSQDAGLVSFKSEIFASLSVARVFSVGRPSSETIQDCIIRLEGVVESVQGPDAVYMLYNGSRLAAGLKMMATYLAALGENLLRLRALRLLRSVCNLPGTLQTELYATVSELACQHIDLGYAEAAEAILNQHLPPVSSAACLGLLRYQLSCSEHALAIGALEQASEALDKAGSMRRSLPPESISRDDRQMYELLHADWWLLHSKIQAAKGDPGEALAAAKRAVKLLNSSWTATERRVSEVDASSTTEKVSSGDIEDAEIDAVATGVSQLNLTPKAGLSESLGSAAVKGAAFWSLAAHSCRAMTHLSDMYAYHGLPNEAEYYSSSACTIAKSVQSTVLLARVECHRSRLMTLTGRLEDAELSLHRCSDTHTDDARLRIERLSAEAFLRAQEGCSERAIELHAEAKREVERLGNCAPATASHSDIAARTGGLTPESEAASAIKRSTTTAKSKAAGLRAVARNGTTKATARGKATAAKATIISEMPRMISKQLDRIDLERALMFVRLGVANQTEASSRNDIRPPRQKFLEHGLMMLKVAESLESAVSFGLLPEAAIASLPLHHALGKSNPVKSCALPGAGSKTKRVAPTALTKTSQLSPAAHNRSCLVTLLECAQGCLATGNPGASTSDTYLECSMIAHAQMLHTAIASPAAMTFDPASEALHIEWPKIHAHRCEASVIHRGDDSSDLSSPFAWPMPSTAPRQPVMTAEHFQEHYIDIIPKPWKVVSLALNEDCSELYIGQYSAGHQPLVLRLPFSRNKPDDEDEEAFDFERGKAELQDIIQISNYSCHNTKGMEGKGAKSNWWAEREALDKRMHELLLNMENIWLGGFKGVFSQHSAHSDLLARFGKSFDEILCRHLPSRTSAKARSSHAIFDDEVLELFTGLGDDRDGTVDLDEPIADLLYFIVDTLQFQGECNAYDEIDFDQMGVEVLDALRSYHGSCAASDESRHLILVLDKRLQAFPWESMPCLEEASASRVSSMEMLRERIIAMRRRIDDEGPAPHRPTVSRSSGAYILNPSKDLTNTQTLLSAPLAGLSGWKSVIEHEPTEPEFSDCLREKSMLLYFGHGAGSQYIRPRSIRKLAKCSSVVWLMGCSSGAVMEYGQLEPFAVPFAYLMAGGNAQQEQVDTDTAGQGCLSVVATLWDVTDKDIDRFSLAVGEEWGLWPGVEPVKPPAKTPKKRERLVAPSTPPRAPKTPKTSKVAKTPAPAAKTPSRPRRRGPRRTGDEKRSLVEAVARSRDACYLRYLNGAAPVVYGVPVYLGD